MISEKFDSVKCFKNFMIEKNIKTTIPNKKFGIRIVSKDGKIIIVRKKIK